MSPTSYPVTVTAELDEEISRGLWLVKWILAIPHYLILLVLWVAFVALSVIAFVSILVTGRYPDRIFDFNVGVMRWTWRVTYYAYGALGTDRYPPFTLADVPDYPAHLEVVRPGQLSRGLVLVKWWLLALPHYLVVALFLGGGGLAVGAAAQHPGQAFLGGGLVGILVLIAAVTLLVTGRYPRAIFDLVIGLQRWVIRVAAYAALMTDVYPPFRLDQGGTDGTAPATGPPAVAPAPATSGPPRRTAPLVLGATALAVGGLLATAAGIVFVSDRVVPDENGFWMTSDVTYSAEGYAITPGVINLATSHLGGWDIPGQLKGEARIVVTPITGEGPLFVGVAPTDDVETYLAGVARSTLIAVRRVDGDNWPSYRDTAGGPPATAPGEQSFWSTSAQGGGRQSISFPLQAGSWTAVVMRADGSRGVTADVTAGASFPLLRGVMAILLAAAAVLVLIGLVVLIGGLTPHRSDTPT